MASRNFSIGSNIILLTLRKRFFYIFNFIQNCNPEPAKTLLCSVDISNLFTNVLLDETIEICADALYRHSLRIP